MRTLAALLFSLAPVALAAAPPDAKPTRHQIELDRLLTSLKSAPDEHTAGIIETRIRGLWALEGSPAAVLLLSRGERDMEGHASGEALADFDDVLALEPDYAEGFNHRAAARAALGDYAGALADIEQVLRRDPRHFTALQALSRLAEQQGDWKGALAAWQKAMELDPMTAGGQDRLDMLQKKVDGTAT